MSRKDQIQELEKHLAVLKTEEAAEMKKAWQVAINTLTRGMTYEEMCGLRDVLNERIRDKYASDAIDDE